MDGGHVVGKRSLNFIRRAENNIKINRIGVNIHMEWSITSCNMVLRVQIPWLPPHATSNLMIVLTSGMVVLRSRMLQNKVGWSRFVFIKTHLPSIFIQENEA